MSQGPTVPEATPVKSEVEGFDDFSVLGNKKPNVVEQSGDIMCMYVFTKTRLSSGSGAESKFRNVQLRVTTRK